MSKQKKKRNSYLGLGLAMLIGGLCGGAVGGAMGFFEVDKWNMGLIEEVLGKWQIPLLGAVLALSVVFGEIVLCKLKNLNVLLEDAEDEEADFLEYSEERYGSMGLLSCHFFMVLTLVFFSVNYNSSFVEKSADSLLVSAGLTVLIYCYQGVWQIRYVKIVQKRCPRLQGDPGCMSQKKFQKAWLESCDEAEKELIYQSGYEAYVGAMRVIPLLAVAAMISHLMWNTGIFAVVMVGVIWIWITVLYCKNCVAKRRKKLNVD